MAATAARRPGPAAPGVYTPGAAGLVSRWRARASGALGGARGWPRLQGVRGPRRTDAHGLDEAESARGEDTAPSRAARSPGVRGVGPPWATSRAARRPLVSRQVPIAPRPFLCYPYIHPGPAALMTTRAPSVRRRTPPLGLHPRAPLGARPRLSRPGDEPERLVPDPRRPGAG